MPDLTEIGSSGSTKVAGGDELFHVDVIREDDQNKMLVKSSNVPQPIGNLFFDYATRGGSIEMSVNGSGSPLVFEVLPNATFDKVVSSMVFSALDGGIKIDTFLGQNSELTNGVVVEVKSEDQVFNFRPITNTQDFDSLFSFGDGRSYELIFASGNDSMVARFGSSTPFVLKPVGTYATDDYIRVTISDNLSNISRLRFIAVGQLDT